MRRGAMRRALALGLAATVALTVGTTGAGAEHAEPTAGRPAAAVAQGQRVTVTTPSTGYYEMPFVMAVRRGFFTEEGLDVTRIQMAPPVSVAAVLSGEAEYALAVGSSTAAIVSANAPMKVVMGIAVKAIHVLVTSDPGVQTISDLRGRSVATSTLTDSSAAITRFALRNAGLEPQVDTALQPLGQSPNRLAAMQTGQVQASILDLAHALEAQRAGARVLARPAELPDLPTAGLSVTDTRLRDQQPQIERMIRATLKGTRAFRDNREEAVVAMIDHLGIDRETAETTYDLGSGAFAIDGIIPEHSLRLLVEAAHLSSGQTTNTAPESLADFSIVQRVYAQMGQ
jgi:NitT/TauT family transport system substrate-binding protein